MLHENIAGKSGFRLLSAEELPAVGGGYYDEDAIPSPIQDGFGNDDPNRYAQWGIFLNDGSSGGNEIIVTGNGGGSASLSFSTGPLSGVSGQSFDASDFLDPTSDPNYLLNQMGLLGPDIWGWLDSNFADLSGDNEIVVTGTQQIPTSPDGASIFMIGNVVIDPSDYDPDADYCGSSSNGTEWLPDSILGVDISFACFVHDQLYGPGSNVDRLQADQIFRNHIYNIILDSYDRAGVSQLQTGLAWYHASAAYELVRAGAEDAYEGNGAR